MSEKNLDKKIIDIFREKEKVNIGYIVAGYPSVDFTKQFLQNLDNTALDMLEVGIPYSDPLADGKLISHASFLASEAGVTTDTVFDLLAEIKNDISKPLIFLIYYSPKKMVLNWKIPDRLIVVMGVERSEWIF